MKDFLSLAFQLKEHATASDWSLTEVLERFEPMVSALAKSEGMSGGSFVASLLAKFMQSMDESKKANKKLIAAVANCLPQAEDIGDEDKDENVVSKSGALDKVSDDCLKLALGFLNYKDRCKAVELSCHRLFHLSRAVPIQCPQFPSLMSKVKLKCKSTAERMCVIHRVASTNLCLDYMKPTLAMAVAMHFRESADTLFVSASDSSIEPYSKIYGKVAFPNLNKVLLTQGEFVLLTHGELVFQSAIDVLTSNSSVTEVVVMATHCSTATLSALFSCFSDCKNLRKLEVYCTADATDDLDASSMNFSHITHLKLCQLSLLRFFLNENVSGKKQVALRFLDLSQSFTLDYSQLRISEPCKLECLRIRTHLWNLARVYDDYAPAHLDFVMQCDSLRSEDMDEVMLKLSPTLANGSAKTLKLSCFNYAMCTSQEKDGIRVLFRWLSQMGAMLQTSIEVRMLKRHWEEVTEKMKRCFVDALNTAVKLTLTNN